MVIKYEQNSGYLTGFVHSSVGLSHVNYLSAVKFNYTIK